MIRFKQGTGRLRPHRVLAATAAIAVVGTGASLASIGSAAAAPGCSVKYTANSWNSGFTASVDITNSGDPITSWALEFDYAGNQVGSGAWGGTLTQTGKHVKIVNAAYNGSLATGASTNVGFNGTYSGTNTNPTDFTLNGVACNGGGTTNPTPTTTTTVSPTATPTPTTTVQPGSHLDNPYVDAKWYVNADWSAKAAAEPGGSAISNQPTGVWLDSIASITAPAGSGYATSLRGHLDKALAQGATLAQFVIYDLPGRDCAALASNGELGPTEIERYKTEYIDPIAAIQADPKYSSIRIVNIVEIDSLPNLVTNAGSAAGATEACRTMLANGNYSTGIAYALSKLHAAGTNNYNYIDAAHHGWLGWDTNFAPAATMFADTAKKATGGVNTVDGFITNTANYSALNEPFVKISTTVNGQSVRQSKWVDWNQYTDELTFAQAFRNQLVSAGFNSNIGMLIDTSRNGWGGSARPTAASTSTDLNTYVDASRIDRRIHAGNWCNQSGAGLGERPKAAPAAGIDAYTWIKPPGESDGSSSLIPTGADNPGGKGFDRMCDPTYTGNGRNGNSMSGALPNAPVSGAWFSAQFRQLLANAYPAL
ncbi:glycoside hydrolase family 6 protein [Kineosporia sp. J2-2]|uniref:Glucanase n=1 Tax=Kineosporia corallincola TaxID=2835133 RepID=A0ABS5TRR9_9ACTN|nr:glycoside hydrolase family 6 protein [Kineosporia corallincola]MBT0773502.1 glycoside hydrolase family 6 protein [Kineosporia corallincola]